MHKYIGHTVVIIYQDRNDIFSQRRIRVSAVGGDKILAYDLDQRKPRTFRIYNILALQPVKSA